MSEFINCRVSIWLPDGSNICHGRFDNKYIELVSPFNNNMYMNLMYIEGAENLDLPCGANEFCSNPSQEVNKVVKCLRCGYRYHDCCVAMTSSCLCDEVGTFVKR